MYTMDRSQSLDEEYKKSLQKIILGMQGCLQVHNPEFVFKIPCSPTNQDIRCEEVQQSTSEKRKAENECDCLENASQKRLKLTESKTGNNSKLPYDT